MKFIRQRYILFEIISQNNSVFDKGTIIKSIWKQLIQVFGEHTTFQVGLWMIRWDQSNNCGLIRCDNITKEEVTTAMALIKKISNIPVIFHTRKTSGTIKKTLKLWRFYFKTEPPKRELIKEKM